MKFLCPPDNLTPLELTIKEYFECEKKQDILLKVSAVQNAEAALHNACLRALAILDGGKQ
jgi:hypothetical protein